MSYCAISIIAIVHENQITQEAFKRWGNRLLTLVLGGYWYVFIDGIP